MDIERLEKALIKMGRPVCDLNIKNLHIHITQHYPNSDWQPETCTHCKAAMGIFLDFFK